MGLSGDHGRLIKWHQPDNFAFVERSRTMKAPVGLLSDRTVLRSKMEGLCPDKFRVVELSRVYHTIPQSASKTKRTTDRSRWFLSSGGGWSIRDFTSQAPASFRSALVGACLLQTLPGTSTANWKLAISYPYNFFSKRLHHFKDNAIRVSEIKSSALPKSICSKVEILRFR